MTREARKKWQKQRQKKKITARYDVRVEMKKKDEAEAVVCRD